MGKLVITVDLFSAYRNRKAIVGFSLLHTNTISNHPKLFFIITKILSLNTFSVAYKIFVHAYTAMTLIMPIAVRTCELPENSTFENMDVNMSTPSVKIGTVLSFECQSDKFVLIPANSSSSVCLQNKTWSTEFPECHFSKS